MCARATPSSCPTSARRSEVMMRSFISTMVAVALTCAAGASAQEAAPIETAPAGWTLTPTFSWSGTWDNNPLIQGRGAEQGDYTTIATPEASLDFVGRRSRFSAGYDGSFLIYQQFADLNSFDQHEHVTATRRMSPRFNLLMQQTFSVTPTTETQLLIGVPFVRIGARLADVSAGVE